MIIYLYGSDSYRRQQKLNEIIEVYKRKHSGLTIDYFGCAEGEEIWTGFKEFIGSQSLFGSSRLAIVFNPPADEAEFLKTVLESKNASVILVAEKSLGKNFEFLLKKPVVSENFEPLSGSRLAAFIKKEAEKKNLKVAPEITISLIKAKEGDIWAIMTELEKISLGSGVEQNVSAPEFFVSIGKLAGRVPLPVKISSLTWLLEIEEHAKVFNILSAFLKTPADKIKIADYDIAIKSGKLEYEEALLDLVISHQ